MTLYAFHVTEEREDPLNPGTFHWVSGTLLTVEAETRHEARRLLEAQLPPSTANRRLTIRDQ